MRMLDILAKLGILRFGFKKGVWRSGKEMPAEMLMDDVYNADRDLITREDLRKLGKALKGKLRRSGPATFCSACGAKLKAGARRCSACARAV